MTLRVDGTTIEVLGKTYQIKCQDKQINTVQRAAELVETRMIEVRASMNLLSVDRVAVVAALQIAYELLNLEYEKYSTTVNQSEKLLELQNRLDKFIE